jgi:hypothetical protein
MTTLELARKLLQYPPDTKVTMSTDWSEPLVNDEYLVIEGEPTVTLACSGHANAASEVERLRAREAVTA